MVLGAGIVGVSTALALQARGHRVLLMDRQEPGLGTSYGNAGVIQREAVEPYAFPRSVPILLGAALKRNNAIHYHAGALPGLARPLSRYWWHSAPARYQRIATEYSALIAHCVSEHRPLVEASGAQHLIRKDGWYQAYRGAAEFAAAVQTAQRLHTEHGLAMQAMAGDALVQIEPALKPRAFAGAIWWQDPWTVSDPHLLVQHYADLFIARGGKLVLGDAASLQQAGAGWRVRSAQGAETAAQVVIALGASSHALLQQLGYSLPLFIKRGYHRHFATRRKFGISLLDVANGMMLAPMRKGLRITTGAEFARLNAKPTPVQIAQSERHAREILDLGEAVEPEPWLGARPCTADMKPVVGPGWLHKGLWFNLGHGHQGLTLGPATARLLAELLDGVEPFVDSAPFLPSRFRA